MSIENKYGKQVKPYNFNNFGVTQNRKLVKTAKMFQDKHGKRCQIGVWSIPSGQFILNGKKTLGCLGMGECGAKMPGGKRTSCYATAGLQGMQQYKGYLAKYHASLQDNFVERVKNELKYSSFTHFRLHDSGDFYSMQYLEKWVEIIQENSNIIFYAYTKSVQLFKEYLVKNGDFPENFIYVYSTFGISPVQEKYIETGDRTCVTYGVQARDKNYFQELVETMASTEPDIYVNASEYDLAMVDSNAEKILLAIH